MTHRGGLSLSIIIWRIGEGGKVSFYPGAQQFSWRPWVRVYIFKGADLINGGSCNIIQILI